MSVCVDETGDQHFSFTVDDLILGGRSDSANLFDSSVSYSDGSVCQDASLRVLGDDPVAILQDETHRFHSWLRLDWDAAVLEAL